MRNNTHTPARIKVGIATYNDFEYLEMLLQSIDWYTMIDEPFDIVVCDDGTKKFYNPIDNSIHERQHPNGIAYKPIIEKVREVCGRFNAILLEHDENKGIPATWNHLALSLEAKAEIVVLLNNDLLMPPQWLDVAVHFLDANKDNPQVGSMFWNPINRVSKVVMREVLPTLGHTTYETRDVLSGQKLDFNSSNHFQARVGDGHGLGRVMCPCGCCFAFRMSTFLEVGSFWEELTSFHEESDWGTACAAKGRAAYGFAYPRPYHTHGASFAVHQELQGTPRMIRSRAMYRAKWNVPQDVRDDAYFKFVDDSLMPQIPRTTLRYLSPDYTALPVSKQLPGGEIMRLPRLVEKQGEF